MHEKRVSELINGRNENTWSRKKGKKGKMRERDWESGKNAYGSAADDIEVVLENCCAGFW